MGRLCSTYRTKDKRVQRLDWKLTQAEHFECMSRGRGSFVSWRNRMKSLTVTSRYNKESMKREKSLYLCIFIGRGYVFLLLSMYSYCCLRILIVVYVFLLLSMYSYCCLRILIVSLCILIVVSVFLLLSMYSYCCLCILIVVYVFLLLV